MARRQYPLSQATRLRRARQRSGYCVYLATPARPDAADALVAWGLSEAEARGHAALLNATLPAPTRCPFSYYYACSGRFSAPPWVGWTDHELDRLAETAPEEGVGAERRAAGEGVRHVPDPALRH